MTFEASTINDIDSIFQFYDMAVEYQKTKFNKHWKGFERDLVEKEISENRQWKIIINNEIACVFAITFEDENIWKEKNSDKAVYFHRIATHPKFKGQHFVEKIVAWGRLFAKEKNLDYLRLDTWGDNTELIDYYQKCGFEFLGITTPDYTGLPKHYDGITLSLFEINLK
ncbi:MAG TPA: GNAT family N-acetyltransferase [Flavobacterium sp.]|jgi:ribosomal protein S18 acetylase RimI-like enzyme|uniref:GNAT family N-acetyltransferase n=1 Tax=Flavobacterium sp. TaxID=239 RepID=UPI001B3CE393|nr:GNAT family N-acetyltransferase [Flavobacterium sp.]MBP6146294.1 GNAT family N-acetyltransferase [Flavobacterium sp.]MBP7182264.1 GNAT family N-acetyltransferase [Flavobacterium sp.]MBP7318807.1 GNAT family N-acetyltransferase [Flavobacterium sp.]MBP8886252.1 GNAT family N-acetyltransferase [Flavobacterium sp.]HRL72228.1 GNAT family N-acetyltransferase [Flavobacterium sp.]